MLVPCSSSRLLGALLLLAGGALLGPDPAPAQDRSVPRFGPLVGPDTVEAGPYDLGRVWSFARPPLDYLAETYDVPADERGLRRVRRSTVRLPDCSGALVSSEGLLLTAARCVRAHLSSAAPESLRTAAFLARRPSRERPVEALYAEQVVEVEDVTDRVDSLAQGMSASAAAAAVQKRRAEGLPPTQQVEVVPEAGGRRHVAYTYRRYDDVRLVFLPDRPVTLFGPADQRLSYPQHAWDVAALRVYRDGEPLRSPEHFDLRTQGARPGDAVFAVGYPRALTREESAAQLAVRRDVTLPARRAALRAWTDHLRTYTDTAATAAPAWSDSLRSGRGDLQDVQARLEALQNDYVQARLEARDEQLRRQAAEEGGEAGAILDSLAALQADKRALADQYRGFSFLRRPAHTSSTLRRAMVAYRARQTGQDVSADALRAVPEQPIALDAARLDDHRRRLRTHLGDDSLLVRGLRQAAPSPALVRRSVFSDTESALGAIEGGAFPTDDPALQIVSAFYGQYEAFDDAWTRLREREARLTDALARARHRIADRPVAPPRGRSPRMADGRVRGYPYNGTRAAPFTTFYGLYGALHAGEDGAPAVPDRWAAPPRPLDRSTPLATVSSTDLVGAHGGPLLNASLQLVGIQTDGNVQSAAGAYLFLPDRMRTVSVDVRGLLEGLSSVYEADALLQELTGSSPSTE
ncbi:MAG: S46 family peptidase [Salinibacter sp.]